MEGHGLVGEWRRSGRHTDKPSSVVRWQRAYCWVFATEDNRRLPGFSAVGACAISRKRMGHPRPAERTQNQVEENISSEDSDGPDTAPNEIRGPCPSPRPLGYKSCLWTNKPERAEGRGGDSFKRGEISLHGEFKLGVDWMRHGSFCYNSIHTCAYKTSQSVQLFKKNSTICRKNNFRAKWLKTGALT